jgi:hypothetical protein
LRPDRKDFGSATVATTAVPERQIAKALARKDRLIGGNFREARAGSNIGLNLSEKGPAQENGALSGFQLGSRLVWIEAAPHYAARNRVKQAKTDYESERFREEKMQDRNATPGRYWRSLSLRRFLETRALTP